MNRIVPITDLRRRFGEITSDLASLNSLILTKGGRPFAIMTPAPELKRERMMKSAGAWKGTRLDDEKLWKDILKRKSRRTDIFENFK